MPWEIRRCETPAKFAKPEEADSPLADLVWDKAPVVFYRHIVKAKPGTTVLLSDTNVKPLLVGHQYGRGRVIVFARTVLGSPRNDQIPFWDDPIWIHILSRAVEWSANR